MQFDVVVVGAGLAGLTAAASAAREGARVGVLSSGIGDLGNFSGCIDVLASHPPGSRPQGVSPTVLLDRLLMENPEHPYAEVGKPWVEEALQFFKSLLPEGEYEGDLQHLIPLPTAVGTIKYTGLVPRSMAAGNLTRNGEILVVGFQGFLDYSASGLSRELTFSLAVHQLPAKVRGETIPLNVLNWKGGAALTCQRLEDERVLNILAEKAAPLLGKATRAGFPAVMGYMDNARVCRYLEERLSVRIFEIPGFPPSIPGLRLFHYLYGALRHRGVLCMLGSRVLAALVERKRCRSLQAVRYGRRVEMQAHQFVFATGGVRGGGLSASPTGIVEPLFGLPVRQPPRRGSWFHGTMFHGEGHPVDRSGIAVDVDLKPVDQEGQVLLENVRACGRILAGQDPLMEKSGGGVAIATGYKAGAMAARQ